jgi:MarR family transcriptional regulator for hemolysin
LRFSVTSALLKVGRNWRRVATAAIGHHGISEAGALPLITLRRLGDGVRQVTVADEIGLEGPSLVRLLDQLCAAGLVERRDDPNDRRAKRLWLTRAGREVTEAMERELTALRTRVFREVSDEDLAAALRVFGAIEAAADPSRALAPADAEDAT